MPTTTSTQGTQFRTGPRVAQDDIEQGDTGIGDTQNSLFNSAAPGAGTSLLITAITAVAGGVYKVRVTVAITGTAETALGNLQLRQNGSSFAVLPTITGAVMTFEIPRVTNSGTAFTLTNTAAATAGSFYTGQASFTRVE